MGDTSSPATSTTASVPVVIGLITAGTVRVEFTVSVVNAFIDGSARQFIVIPSGPYLDMGRNNIVKAYNAQRAEDPALEYLLMVDSDIQFTGDDIRTLVDAAEEWFRLDGVRPVVAGTYLGMNGGERSIIAYDWHDVTRDDGSTERQLQNVPVAQVTDNPPCLREVGGVGTGFMLIHHSILDEMPAHFSSPQEWFAEIVVDGTWFGEDLIFCMRVAELGHPVLLHTGVRLPHYKEIGLVF